LCIADPIIDNGSFDPNGDNIYFSQIPSGPYRIGQYAVTLKVADEYGNSRTCGGQVTVTDCTPPTITCPASTTAECTANLEAMVDPGDAVASDTCSALTVTDPGPGRYPLGSTLVSYTARDASSNAATCTTTVSVVDTTPPIITCPAPITAECTDHRQAIVDPGHAVASDLCSTVALTDPGPASFPLGSTPISYTATDGSGNSATCNTTLSVVDTTGPTISCNARDIVPPEAPISFTAQGHDLCDDASVTITSFDCSKLTKKGKHVDKTKSCVVKLDGNRITIVDSGGVDTEITWTVVATDPSGNSSAELCSLTVRHPGHAWKHDHHDHDDHHDHHDHDWRFGWSEHRDHKDYGDNRSKRQQQH
jgi:hypothetical protein